MKPKIFSKVPETKSDIQKICSDIRKKILDGDVDPLLFAAQAKAVEALITNLRKDHLIKDVILEAAEKYSEKTFEAYNATFTKKEAGVKYDYSKCNDVELESLLNEKRQIEEKIKKRQDYLKAIPTDEEVYNQYGEQLFPPVKKSETIVSINLKK